MDQKKSNASFHHSDRGDVYDLYNACNGAMHNGLLDIRRLDQLSVEEFEILDLSRLREVWAHTASGCSQCQTIINTLNSAREVLRRRVTEHDSAMAPAADAVHIDLLRKP